MRGILVLAGKDLRNLFLSPLFYVISGLCTIVFTLIYFLGLREFAAASQANIIQTGENTANLHFVVFAKHISAVNFVMLCAVSAMSMRLFTEEKKNHTMALLLTSPISATQITLGKFLAALIGTWAIVAVSFLYPLSLRLFTELQWAPLLSSYIVLFLLTGCYVAIGMFASSLTESSVITVIMAFIFNMMLWFVGAVSDATTEPWLTKTFEQLNVGVHFMNFIRGSVSVSGFVYFLSVMFLMTFLTQRVVESNRWR